jgi:GNAT superfamily N-acetyltransferase
LTETRDDFHARRVDAAVLLDLRRRVLRAGRLDAVVTNPDDDDADARHFAGYLGERVVVSASFFAVEGPLGATRQLRYMATDLDVQGRGLGAAVLAAAETALAAEGVRALWANARDSALGFYERCGWRAIVGSEHVSAETHIPHTVIVKDLGATQG